MVDAAVDVLQRYIRGALVRRRWRERREAMRTILHRLRAFFVRTHFRAQLPPRRRSSQAAALLQDHQALRLQAQRRREKEALGSGVPQQACALLFG